MVMVTSCDRWFQSTRGHGGARSPVDRNKDARCQARTDDPGVGLRHSDNVGQRHREHLGATHRRCQGWRQDPSSLSTLRASGRLWLFTKEQAPTADVPCGVLTSLRQCSFQHIYHAAQLVRCRQVDVMDTPLGAAVRSPADLRNSKRTPSPRCAPA